MNVMRIIIIFNCMLVIFLVTFSRRIKENYKTNKTKSKIWIYFSKMLVVRFLPINQSIMLREIDSLIHNSIKKSDI